MYCIGDNCVVNGQVLRCVSTLQSVELLPVCPGAEVCQLIHARERERLVSKQTLLWTVRVKQCAERTS